VDGNTQRAERRVRHWGARASGRIVADCLAWCIAVTFASILRVDFDLGQLWLHGQLLILPAAIASHLLAAWMTGLYAGRWRVGSFDEVAALARTIAIATALLASIDALSGNPRLVPLAAPIGGGIVAFVLTGAVRYVIRVRYERARRPTAASAARVLVFGAGVGGEQVITAMLRDPTSPYIPVALLDDDPARQRLSIMGVRVVGTRRDVERAARQHGASMLLIAIPRAGRALVTELTDCARDADLTVKVLPSNRELLDGAVRLADIRDLTLSDLLGRREIQTEVETIAGYLTGKRVLVTGAGGSIGSELCRQIRRFAPAELMMLDRDESALHGVQLSIEHRALLDDGDVCSLVLADIRDTPTIAEIFRTRAPQVVFHAAALKHLSLLERFPHEALRTNVFATLDLLELARQAGVERFVNVSTDKAADPISVLGYTKRIAERLTAHVAGRADGVFLSVRFGNVLGSRGSVLDTFQAQIAAGGPITVTDPEVVRFFMTTAEAVELLIQAGGIGGPGEVLVLDMGEPVRIADVARSLAELTQPDVEIVYTGLRQGEKLEEVLFGEDEVDRRPTHPLIAQVDVPPLAPSALAGAHAAHAVDAAVAIRIMRALANAHFGAAAPAPLPPPQPIPDLADAVITAAATATSSGFGRNTTAEVGNRPNAGQGAGSASAPTGG
jgi:FlaA1/EpsC-like NDP-sugar epimerase